MGKAVTGQIVDLGLGRRSVRKTKARAVTAAKRQRFLDALALTCNVIRAAEHAGFHHGTAYKLRKADPVFAALWRDAIEAAYDRIELLVLEHGGAGVALDAPDGCRARDDGLTMPFDFDRAMTILRQYRARRDGNPPVRGHPPPTNAIREETNAALVKALAAVRKRLDAERARDA